MNDLFDNLKLVRVILRWKIQLSIIAVVAVFVGVFISSPIVIEPLYESNVVAYPVNLGHYSEETSTEQMIQILNSNYISDEIIEEFDFYNKYDIDRSDAKAEFKVNKVYDNRVTFEPTKYESVRINVKDPDPDDAYSIAKKVVEYYNDKVALMYRKKVKEVMDIQKITLEQFNDEITEYEIALEQLRREYGVLDYVKQTERITEGYVKALQSDAGQSVLGKIEKMLEGLEQKGGEYMSIQSKLNNARLVYNKTYVDYQRSKKEYTKNITYAQVITEPKVAQEESYPPRTIIVLFMFFATMLVALFILSHIEKESV